MSRAPTRLCIWKVLGNPPVTRRFSAGAGKRCYHQVAGVAQRCTRPAHAVQRSVGRPAVRGGHVGRRWLSSGISDDDSDEGRTKEERETDMSRLKAIDVLKARQRKVCQIHCAAPVEEAINLLASNNAASAMVYDSAKGTKDVIGLFTARDVLKKLYKHKDKAEGLRASVRDMMTPIGKVITCSPDESLEKIQWLMTGFKIRNVPVIKDGVIYGIVTLGDISDHKYTMEELGGKKAFMKGVSGRLGLPLGSKIASHVVKEGRKKAVKFKVGLAELPHPFKRPNAVAADLRDHGPNDFAKDASLSEDASFARTVPWLHEHGDEATFIGIADGVGSWREHGVDPRAYSHRLMELADEFVQTMAPKTPSVVAPVVRPLDVLMYAWERITKEQVVGSSTACIATLDHELNQLSFCNVGDNGIIIMSHIDSDVAGYMRDKTTPRPQRAGDLRIAYVSRQQLRSFNLPYQLGYTNTVGVDGVAQYFETPGDADNSSIPLLKGDTVVIATDGLFDNVEMEDICSMTLAWEEKWFSNGRYSGGLVAADFPEESVQDLALTLARRARELSVDRHRDSPFALLAKENDIMWGGGMPDDCTVAVLRVVRS